MTQVLIDGIGNLSIHNGVLRVECTTVGADGQPHPSGTLVIPAPVAMSVMQAIVNGMTELGKKIKEQQQQPNMPPAAGNA